MTGAKNAGPNLLTIQINMVPNIKVARIQGMFRLLRVSLIRPELRGKSSSPVGIVQYSGKDGRWGNCLCDLFIIPFAEASAFPEIFEWNPVSACRNFSTSTVFLTKKSMIF